MKKFLNLNKILLKLQNLQTSFDYLKIAIASPKRITNWASRILPDGSVVGEVASLDIVSLDANTPEINGLFCEKIFGPINNWQCSCGKYFGFSLNKVCEICNVELTESRVRRYRMGFVELSCPIAHSWYFKGAPNYICEILRCFNKNISPSHIEQIVYYNEGDRSLFKKNPLYSFFYPQKKNFTNLNFIINEKKSLTELCLELGFVNVRRGSEILKAALDAINLSLEIEKLRSLINYLTISEIKSFEKQNFYRLRILESFLIGKINPSWMILTFLPILPPGLRPIYKLENDKCLVSDTNELYRIILQHNYGSSEILDENSPDFFNFHERKLLQESIDSLINATRIKNKQSINLNNNNLKSLTEILEGKYGRFRHSLLGKRVDFSARSVITVGPNLRLNQCGLPYEILIELFQPFLIGKILELNPKLSKKRIQEKLKKKKLLFWNLLEFLTKKHSILLNRAPTLHRFGVQAFDPVLILGKAIQVHPLVCAGFNADFDGDQMGVYLPLYKSSQVEIKSIMRPSHNILSASNSELILKPAQDMVIGSYYLTLMLNNNFSANKNWFKDEENALSFFYQKKISLHTPIIIEYPLNLFKIKRINNVITFTNSQINFSINNNNFKIKKIFSSKLDCKKYFILTNIGVFIALKNKYQKYEICNIFLETTIGRIIFSNNFKNIINIK